MAQTGYTPILIYSSSTTTNAPAVGNLTNSTLGSELAINITDGKLFYKDNANAIQVIGWKTTPTTAGGTGLTSYTAGDLLYYATGTTLSKLAIGASTTILTSSGTAPQWSAASGITVGTATNLAGGVAGSVPYQSGAGATTFLGIGAANTVLTSSGSAPQWSTALTLSGNLRAANISVPDTNWIGWGNYASRFTGSGGGSINVVTNSVTAATWDTSQNYSVVGNVVISTSGKGIDFSATPGTGTSELFADYEEGTFTPTVVGSTSAGTATYSGANGRYTKVGRIVEFEIYLDWTSGTGTGNLLFGGLPFTANSSLPYASVTIGYIHNFTWTALKYPMALTIGTQVNFFLQQLGGGAIASMGYSASGTTYVSGTYTV
jgi:hypothetical protein